jgi:hypothetical protein
MATKQMNTIHVWIIAIHKNFKVSFFLSKFYLNQLDQQLGRLILYLKKLYF